MSSGSWPFDVAPRTAVVTTKYVMTRALPVVYVSHEIDGENGELQWQFHCGNGDYRPEVLLLVALEEVLDVDPTLRDVAALPVGHAARRTGTGAPWVIAPERE